MEMVRQHQLGFDLLNVSSLTSFGSYRKVFRKRVFHSLRNNLDQPTPAVSFRGQVLFECVWTSTSAVSIHRQGIGAMLYSGDFDNVCFRHHGGESLRKRWPW